MQNSILNLPESNEPLRKGDWNTVRKLRTDQGIAMFTSSKNVNIVFATPFTTPPRITTNFMDDANSPDRKSVVTSSWFTIKMKTSWTGNIERAATARP